jgi:hypothetical protein
MHAYFRPKRSTCCFALSRHLLLGIAILCALCHPYAISAQSVLTINTQQCLWHSGDNPASAAATLNESSWRPYSEWRSDPGQPHLWVRCHIDMKPIEFVAQPAIQIDLFSAYQVYLNGSLLAGAGNLQSGIFSLSAIREYPVHSQLKLSEPGLLALRITAPNLLSNSGQLRSLIASPLQIRVGDPSLLDAIRSQKALARSMGYLRTALYYGIIGVLAIPLLALYLFDRTRTPVLLLGLICLGLAELRMNEFAIASMAGYSVSAALLLVLIGNTLLTFTETPFVYVLARRRIPTAVWVLLVTTTITYLPSALDALWGVNMPTWLFSWNTYFVRPFAVLQHVTISSLPFFAFWPYSSIAPRIRPIAALCMMWSAVDVIWFVVQGTSIPIPGVPNVFNQWGVAVLDARGIATACLLFALLVLLFREQRQITRDRAFFAGELQAAGEIQRMLAPAEINTAPGLHIEVAFHPMREVGGDFYLCRILPDGRQRVLIGDVSGKGSAAAMTAALLLGGATARKVDSPGELLSHLNQVLSESRVAGFATCLCADFAADGRVTLANAGHLAPYLRGEEISVPPGLPLGLNPQTSDQFQQFEFTLSPNDTLTLISDGVVEARSSTGALFGFDRTRAISNMSAGHIAHAAQSHGQEDDITVLTLTFAPVEVAHA